MIARSISVLLVLSIWSGEILNAQTYTLNGTIDGTTQTTCSGTFYDSGGSGSNYSNDEDYTITFCSGNTDSLLSFDFTSWNVENNSNCNWDYLRIYDGTSTSDPLIGEYCTNSPGTVESSGTCLHFVWHSDYIVNESGWAATISCVYDLCGSGDTYEDNFAASAYNNSNGTTSWTSNSWVETGDNGSPTSGDILISGQELVMDHDDSTLPSIARAVDLTGATAATFSFDYREVSNLEPQDVFQVSVYDGTSWTVLLTVSNDYGSQSASFDITAYANANTQIRFAITQGYAGSGEFVYFDDIKICYTTSSPVVKDVYLEAECGYVGSNWFQDNDQNASNGTYTEPRIGLESLSSAPEDTSAYMTYVFNVDSADFHYA